MDYAEIESKMKRRPHVVICGAGASIAAIPDGDANGNKISVMKGFINKLGMAGVISACRLNTNSDNLEDIYMELYERDSESLVFRDARIKLEQLIEQYFTTFVIPKAPTAYDYLILGLTKKDLIASFNWDPLLMQAYQRCKKFTRSLPEIVFLHGNVAIGVCKNDKRVGIADSLCSVCGNPLARMRLLYPIKNKDYTSDLYISDSWRCLQHYLKIAYRLTIFGYSAPKSDIVARSMLKEAWGKVEERALEEIEIIDIASEEVVTESWADFIHTHHYSVYNNIFASAIGMYPRRTCDVLFDNTMNVRWSSGERGFKDGMNFTEINKLLVPLLEDETRKKDNEILDDPYLIE